MKRFEDGHGRHWDVVLGRESWGALYALFVPAGAPADRPIRQTLLKASGYDEAERELATLDPEALRALFDRSEPKPT